MQYRRLGRTNLKVSVVGIGTWQFGGDWGKDFELAEVRDMFAAAKESGINLIDTAECYGDHTSERLIGEAVEHERDQWIIATKFGHNPGADHAPEINWQAAEVKRQFDESLHSLRTDYVDILQFHSGNDEVFDNEELWSMLDEEVQAGRIRHLGISIGSNRNLYQTDRAAAVHASVIQVVYNRINRAPEEEVFASCERQDLGVLARVPLASGFLAGKYRPGARWQEGDVRHSRNPEETDAALAEVEKIRVREVPDGTAMATWALAWCLRNPAVTCVIPGCKSVEQVRTNADAALLVEPNHPQDWRE
jgi:aryl-alcohol dehydrogenase-like predicted oxidoreductase